MIPYIRIRFKKLGGHYHCRVFTSQNFNGTYANCGELTFDEREFIGVKDKLGRCEWIDDNKHSIPCELCGTPTQMTNTKRCDSCWELESRIQRSPKLAAEILRKCNTGAAVVLRRPCLPEDEGRYHYQAYYSKQADAYTWVQNQAKEYFEPGDYLVLELP